MASGLEYPSWTIVLEFIAAARREEEVRPFVEITSTMSLEDRAASTIEFPTKSGTSTLPMSRADGIDINLTAATYVHTVGLLYTPAQHGQVKDCAQCLGQDRAVPVVRFAIQNRVEKLI